MSIPSYPLGFSQFLKCISNIRKMSDQLAFMESKSDPLYRDLFKISIYDFDLTRYSKDWIEPWRRIIEEINIEHQ